MIEHHINIYPHERFVTFENDMVGSNIWSPLPREAAYVSALTTVVVPPMSEMLIKLKINQNYKPQQSLLTPLDNLHSKNIAMAKCLISPRDHETFCKVLNPTQASVYIKKNTRLGIIQPVHNDEIFALNDSNKENNNNKIKETNISLKTAEDIVKELEIPIHKEHLSEEEYGELIEFLAKNQDLFAKSIVDLPGTDVMYYKIDTGDAKPVQSRTFRLSPNDKKEVERQIELMLEHDIIQPSDSPWNSPCFLVAKHGSTEKRLVVDFRRLNCSLKGYISQNDRF